jgi:hypothetical protein
MDKRLKIGLIAGGILVALILVFAVVTRNGDVEVQIVAVPDDSTITIDGQPAKTGKTVLKAGEHTIKAAHQYFADYETKVNTKNLTRGQKIFLVPSSNTPEALDWLYKHPGDPQLTQEAGDAVASMVQTEIHDNYPFLDKFPYESIDYKIDYQLSDDRKTLSFTITLLPYAMKSNTAAYNQQLHDFKAEALKFLTDNGIDTSKYKITYDPPEAKDL